jgi:lysophospholipase L1-like esterase
MAASLFLSLLVGELLLRAFWHDPFVNEQPDHVLKLPIHHPNTDLFIDRSSFDEAEPVVRFRTDERSYIRPSFQYDKPDATVAFFGGSTTACNAVAEELRFPALVSRILEERGLRVNTLNAGRSSGTLHDSLNVLLNHVVEDRPDFAVVMHATNDIGVLSRDPSYRSRRGSPVSLAWLGKWSAQMLSSRFYLMGLARVVASGRMEPRGFAHVARKNDPSLPKVPTEPFRARLLSFIHISRDFGIEPVLMTQPLSSSRNALTPDWADLGNQDVFNAVVREVGEQEGVLVIDLVRRLQEEVPGWDRPGRVFYDGMHVNDAGSRIYADFIARALEAPLRRLAEGRGAGRERSARPDPPAAAASRWRTAAPGP